MDLSSDTNEDPEELEVAFPDQPDKVTDFRYYT